MNLRSILGLTIILAIAVWLAAWGENWRRAYAFTGRQEDYYNLLVHGFLKGHLYLDVAVDPRLLSSDLTVRRQAGIEADASFYRGKYYLYFGVVPAALLFLPYRLVTGQDLSENAACLALVLIGFGFYLRLYAEARRRHFAGTSWAVNACGVLLLAFGAGTPSLLILGGRYEIAIAGGYACMAGAWLALFSAQQSARHAAGWLAAASLGFGLAVGCRPTYLLMAPALAIGAVLTHRHRAEGSSPLPWLRVAVAALAPAAVLGLLLGAYNYARFGNPLEFGFSYQPNNSDLLGLGQNTGSARLRFLWPNLKWYYLQRSTLSPYFPYVFPINFTHPPAGYVGGEASHGQWPAFLLLLYCGCSSWPLWGRRGPGAASLRSFLVPLGVGFACMLAGLACFSTITNRYIVDFQGAGALLLALTGGCLASAGEHRPGRSFAWRTGFGGLAVATALFSLLASLQLADRFAQTRPQTYRWLAQLGDYPAGLAAKWGLLRYGPVRFTLVFAPVARPTVWPLVATGVHDYTDVLYVIQHPSGLAQFMMVHEGQRDFRSALIPVQVGRPYPMEVDLGSLYPPAHSPYFRDWPAPDVEALKTRTWVQFDGETVIHQKAQFYDAPPNWVFLGQSPTGDFPAFGGQILHPQRLSPTPRGVNPAPPSPGAWRLQVSLPLLSPQAGHPLVASGTNGHGNLLFMRTTPTGAIRFGFDQWNFALTESPDLPAGPGLHWLEIFVGPQVARQAPAHGWPVTPGAISGSSHLLRVWLDGHPVWTTAVAVNLDTYDEVALGNNPQGFSTAQAYFLGSLTYFPYAAPELQEFVERNLKLSATEPAKQ